MTWLRSSTNKPLQSCIIPALAALALISGGCGIQKRPVQAPPLRGFVNLDTLTRRHPGWSGVSRYDAALQRLEAAARSLPPAGRPDQKIASLPALPKEIGGRAVLPIGDVGRIERRLTAVQQLLLDELRSRREMARLDQLRSQRDIWRREARQQFPAPTEMVATRPDLELQLLQANVETLTRTLNNWKLSASPAPKREALRAKVQADHARLEALITDRSQVRESAQMQHLAEVQRVRDARTAYVQMEADELTAQLLADDARVVAGQQARLVRQRAALLAALARPSIITVASAGDAGALALPRGRGEPQAALSRASLIAAETRLRAQRARWVQYLYEDTQAAARDAAGQHNWDVTFGTPRPGDRDLTQALAQAMASEVWQL